MSEHDINGDNDSNIVFGVLLEERKSARRDKFEKKQINSHNIFRVQKKIRFYSLKSGHKKEKIRRI